MQSVERFLMRIRIISPSTPFWPSISGRQAAGTCEIACDAMHFHRGRSRDELDGRIRLKEFGMLQILRRAGRPLVLKFSAA